jgi:hypothetical protein
MCVLNVYLEAKLPAGSHYLSGKIHDHFNDHGYLFTWEDTKTEHLELSWSEAREFCRTRCMELVSIETKAENEFIKDHIDKG